MTARFLLLIFIACTFPALLPAQPTECSFKPPFYHMHFGSGNVQDVNISALSLYDRVAYSCPGDGYYAYAPSIADCFGGDWHQLTEDHTPSDVNGNMLVVNAAYNAGKFLSTSVKGFKGQTVYQLGIWLMNVCKPSKKCPFPLLPNLTVRLQTTSGKTVAQFLSGELPRMEIPQWSHRSAQFTAPAGEPELILTLIDNAPGGCGNDFVLDDITFSECVKTVVMKKPEVKTQPVLSKKQPLLAKKEAKKEVPVQVPVIHNRLATVQKNEARLVLAEKPIVTPQPVSFIPAPVVLQERTNALVKHIETVGGDILLELYDNGEIDGDTVSIYHNNVLVIARQRLSHKPIAFRIQVDKIQPHHELIMVADNLGSIPPNTSMMIVTAQEKRYQVFISSTEKQNAKVVIDLKE